MVELISRYFRIDFTRMTYIRPWLAGQGLNQVLDGLELALEQAQWAALNGEAASVTAARWREARSVLSQLQPGPTAEQGDAGAYPPKLEPRLCRWSR